MPGFDRKIYSSIHGWQKMYITQLRSNNRAFLSSGYNDHTVKPDNNMILNNDWRGEEGCILCHKIHKSTKLINFFISLRNVTNII